jgi:hypothetical protein
MKLIMPLGSRARTMTISVPVGVSRLQYDDGVTLASVSCLIRGSEFTVASPTACRVPRPKVQRSSWCHCSHSVGAFVRWQVLGDRTSLLNKYGSTGMVGMMKVPRRLDGMVKKLLVNGQNLVKISILAHFFSTRMQIAAL